jgi:predicted Ser/Thr protein kinase
MLIGGRLGQYELTEVLGRGGMATVYRARQPSLGRDVAVKVLHEFLEPQSAARFEREARSVAQLQHPNILPVYDYGEEEGRRYFVTQYIADGRTLGDLIAEGPLAPAHAIALAERVLDALAYAHRAGIVHRDIKPANIMLPRPDWPLLGDFGIADILSATTQFTAVGQIIGTPSYMAPERASDRPSDPRSDIYALGVVLYEMLAGRLPFEADSAVAVLMKHVAEEPPPLGSLAPGLAPGLAEVVHTALAKNPDERFAGAEAMAAALRAIAAGTSAPAPPLPRPAATIAQPRPAPAPIPATAPPPRPAPQAPPARLEPLRPTLDRPGRSRLPLLAVALVVVAVVAFVALRAGRGAPDDGPEGALLAGGPALRLDDAGWEGGYGGAGDPREYGGRSAAWVYGQGTDYTEMRAGFDVGGRPGGRAVLTVEGMDSEGPAKTEIRVTVNGAEIYRGANPLPDDDFDPATGTWATHSWEFDAGLLRPGRNIVAISNLSPGAFSLPPFFMLDYADIAILP